MLPIKVRSIYSVSSSVLRTSDIAKWAKDNGSEWACICDIGNLSGAYDFHKDCKKVGVKPVIGCELTLSNESGKIILFSKNLKGWKELCRLVSLANSKERYSSQPILKPEDLSILNNAIVIVESKKVKDIVDKHCSVPVELFKDLKDIRAINEESKQDLKVVLASKINTPIPVLANKVDNNELFENSDLFVDAPLLDQCEVDNSLFRSVEEYELNSPPVLPRCYDGDEELILRKMCRDGWKELCQSVWDKEVYAERVKTELETFEKFSLSGYFLIIKDLVDYARKNGWLTLARGSVGGSIIAYLLRISVVDPIKHKLLLSRFFNPSRAEGALPDIDVDIETEHREKLIDYLRYKYGEECVSQIITFNKLKGSGALKEVLRMHKACDFSTANEITKNMPEEAKISTKMKESGESSIILWTLKYMPHVFKDYCTYKDGRYYGDYAEHFKQAVRIEGCIKSTGKHAAGILVSNTPLKNDFPMMYDQNSDFSICGLEYTKAEAMGAVKIDVLGVSALSKLATVNKLLKFGKIPEGDL